MCAKLMLPVLFAMREKIAEGLPVGELPPLQLCVPCRHNFFFCLFARCLLHTGLTIAEGVFALATTHSAIPSGLVAPKEISARRIEK